MNLPEGWFDKNDVSVYSELLLSLPNNSSIAELGVAKGRSLCSVAEILKEKNISVHAVDTFEGTENEGTAHADAKTTDWKEIFLKNAEEFGIANQVFIHRGRTDERHQDFLDGSLDLIFIDADHSAEAVREDIRNWRPKLKEGGILAGHDWSWASVRDGIAQAGVDPVNDGNFWFVLASKKQNKPLWSITLIARNESKHLPRALESLKEFRDRGGEVVVLDTGSTDNTAQIARDAGCVVEEVGNKFLQTLDKETVDKINEHFVVDGEAKLLNEGDTIFDFGSARNYCASFASNDMVSMMDCDEVFTKLDIDKINEYIQNGFTQFEYNFIFSHLPDGSPAVQFTQSKAYDRTKLFWDGILHEVLSGHGRRKYLGQDIISLEHFQNVETDRRGYLRGLALDCYLHPEKDRQSHYFARECLWTGRPKTAIKEFKRHVAMNRWPTEKSQSYVFMGDAYMMLGNEQEALRSYHDALVIEGGRREPLIRFAEHFQRKGDAQHVAIYAMAALQIPQGGFYANNSAHYRHVPHELLYSALWYLNRKEEGKEHFDKAMSHQPLNSKYLHDYRFYYSLPSISIIIPTLGRPEGLKRCLDSITALNYPQELIQILTLDGEGTVPEKVKTMLPQTNGEYVVFGSNDIEFSPDSLIIAVIESKNNNKALVAFNTGEVLDDEGNTNEHFLIRKDFISEIGGEIFDTRYYHVGVDNILWLKCKKLNNAFRSKNAKVIHYHFSKGASFDEVYARGWDKDRVAHDRKLFEEDKKKLYAEA